MDGLGGLGGARGLSRSLGRGRKKATLSIYHFYVQRTYTSCLTYIHPLSHNKIRTHATRRKSNNKPSTTSARNRKRALHPAACCPALYLSQSPEPIRWLLRYPPINPNSLRSSRNRASTCQVRGKRKHRTQAGRMAKLSKPRSGHVGNHPFSDFHQQRRNRKLRTCTLRVL